MCQNGGLRRRGAITCLRPDSCRTVSRRTGSLALAGSRSWSPAFSLWTSGSARRPPALRVGCTSQAGSVARDCDDDVMEARYLDRQVAGAVFVRDTAATPAMILVWRGAGAPRCAASGYRLADSSPPVTFAEARRTDTIQPPIITLLSGQVATSMPRARLRCTSRADPATARPRTGPLRSGVPGRAARPANLSPRWPIERGHGASSVQNVPRSPPQTWSVEPRKRCGRGCGSRCR